MLRVTPDLPDLTSRATNRRSRRLRGAAMNVSSLSLGFTGAVSGNEPSTTMRGASTHSAWAIGLAIVLSDREPGGRKPFAHHTQSRRRCLKLQTFAARYGGESCNSHRRDSGGSP
jgi:hypothetical protein